MSPALIKALKDYYGETIAEGKWVDLGSDHAYSFSQFAPDRALNPQYDGVPDVPRYGALVAHLKADGSLCMGAIHFDTPEVRAVNAATRAHCEKIGSPYGKDYSMWQVQSWEPLSVSPSLQCGACPDHGFIRDGRWVRA